MKRWGLAGAALVMLGLHGTVPVAGAAGEDAAAAGFVADPFDDPFDDVDTEKVRDPWEPFNSSMFALNHRLDRYLIKPAATAYDSVLPAKAQHAVGNVFHNAGFPSRFLNNVLQGKFSGAGLETQRFLLNTTLGAGGLFDVASSLFEIDEPPAEDVGQTLAVYGVRAGPYLVLPLLPPLTVRDAVGYAGQVFLNPASYFLPFSVNLGLAAGEQINSRSLNLKTFEGIEAATLDLYGAVRAGYLDSRRRDILE